jgi:threonine dehydrogenase-like Zn-dependent dehydrogenase
MKALRYTGKKLVVSGIPVPSNGTEALVRVLRSGICNTDLEIVRGSAGIEGTIGHEFVGIAESSPERRGIIGKRVVGEINAGCGECDPCVSGDSRHCPARTVLGIVGRDGAHAEFLQLPSRNLIEVPENVTDDQAVFAEPLAAAFGITEQVDITSYTKVAVIGDGKLGILSAMCLALGSNSVTLIGKHSNKLSIAKKCGVDCVLLNNVNRSMAGMFDVVVEASGSESGFNTAIDLVRPRGTIVLKSTFHGTPAWSASRVVVNEITVVGSRCGRMKPAVDLLASGAIKVDDLIDEEFSLSDGVAALERAEARGVLMVLLKP